MKLIAYNNHRKEIEFSVILLCEQSK